MKRAATAASLLFVALAAVCLSTAIGRASQPPHRSCEDQPAAPAGFSAADAQRLTRLLRQAAAAVPRTRGDRCRVDFDDVPGLRRRDACWQLPDEFAVSFQCPAWSLKAPERPLVNVGIALSTRPADYPADGEILESTPDLLVVNTPQRWTVEMIFGARGRPWIVSQHAVVYDGHHPRDRPEDYYRGPYVSSVKVSISAVHAETGDQAKQMLRRFDRAAILKLIKAEQDLRRASKHRRE